ncbi:telomerase reverse transcriptase, putative [Cordyceps militaris CM01]|uniref:Telomerase reverse transcriptase n=1 Tax=Cordyceps militaris (strain CM01) TaxID=983644 RepID=G3JHR0_CORMM|nr:telomerase reverse transcriptase, putative [Cordyceps militaris CM01]EGX91766.1 telomerase reverse transcriptase, putative [Cordyceps militaris CM01]
MTKRKRAQKDASSGKNAKGQPAPHPLHRDLLNFFYPHCISLREYALASLPQTSRLRRRKIKSLGTIPERFELEKDLCCLLDSTLVCYHQLTPDVADNRWEQWLSFSQRGEDSSVSLTGGSPIYSQSEIVDFVIWLIFSRDNNGFFGPKHLLCDGYRRRATEKAEPERIPGVFSRYPNDQVASLKAGPWPQLLNLLGRSGERIMINMLVDCSIFVAMESGLNNFYQISELEHGLEMKKGPEKGICARKLSEISLVRSRVFYARPPMTSRGHIEAGYRHIREYQHLGSWSAHQILTTLDALNRYNYIPEHESTESIVTQKNTLNTAKVMMYVFPRQFGLHNVFTSTVDSKTTVQKLQDYTVRDDEIAQHMRSDKNFLTQGVPKIPKRLRGAARDLVRRLQILHRRCSYIALIRHYCASPLDPLRERTQKNNEPTSTSKTAPSQAADGKSSKQATPSQTQRRTQDSRVFQLDPSVPIVDLATPVSHVSVFLQAVLSKILPGAFLGEGDDLRHNQALLAKKAHHFVTLRRFESMSLHELSQGFKISSLAWLQLPGRGDQKPSQNETFKQLELFHELLYYIFDSLLIPLMRNTFYVTESNTHRYQVFYFRHDVWKLVSERALRAMKDGMLEELKVGDVQRAVESRRLGFSQIRLLPKGTTLRPIMNLRRRYPLKQNKKMLGPSINTVLAPIHNVLKLEKRLNPSKLGATLFSVGDIYNRLKEFRRKLPDPLPRLYFVKADVQSAFDTIPQEAVLKLMAAIPSHEHYKIFKHAEVKPGERPPTNTCTTAPDGASTSHAQAPSRPIRRWHSTAHPGDESGRFHQRLDGQSSTSGIAAQQPQRKNTVFVNSAVQSDHDTRGLLRLLAEHVADNRIRVGKKTYRQRRGIPQGSVLSSYLCNYFYADLEARHLRFLDDSGSHRSVLLRLVDDFLLVTTDRARARRFAAVLHRGVPEYGVHVSPHKSLANFALSVPPAGGGDDGPPVPIATVHSTADFPYCGVRISCRTLEIKKDCQREQQTDVANTLTVEHSRVPGQNFQRKVLRDAIPSISPKKNTTWSPVPSFAYRPGAATDAFKIQSHLMFYDTSHNSPATVLDTLRAAFRQTALKMWAYMRALHRTARPRPGLVKLTITRTVEASYLIITSRFRKLKYQGYECSVRKTQVTR